MRLDKIETYPFSLSEIINDSHHIQEIKKSLDLGVLFKIPHDIDIDFLRKFKKQLDCEFDLSDTEYKPRIAGCENYRQRHWDHPNQVVPAKFISWSLFPWNKSSDLMFKATKEVFILRNLLAGLPRFQYIDHYCMSACARLAFQFYPCGEGYMEEHVDPLNKHQFAIPTLQLSDFGKNFVEGGVFAVDGDGKRVFLDEHFKFGDLTLFHTSIPHGVGVIDKYKSIADCKSIYDGRLMMIMAVNGYYSTNQDYESKATEYGKN
jgi:hypothetical protein